MKIMANLMNNNNMKKKKMKWRAMENIAEAWIWIINGAKNIRSGHREINNSNEWRRNNE